MAATTDTFADDEAFAPDDAPADETFEDAEFADSPGDDEPGDGEPGDDLDPLDAFEEAALVDADGDGPSAEVLDELAALDELDAAEAATVHALQAALAEVQGRASDLETRYADAVTHYREALLAADPAVPADLVTGDSIEAVDASIAAARRTVAQVRAQLERGFSPGAPARTSEAAFMSPGEKIAAGLRERGRD